jgi:hypothetical protein
MPSTLLWFSTVYKKWLSSLQGKNSPTSFKAPVAPEVNMQLYSFGDALKYLNTC